MKITKSQLKQIIKEEFEKTTSATMRSGAMQGVKDVTAGGISDQERGVIQKLQAQLARAAKIGNITSGRVFQLAQRLSAELEKVSPAETPEEG
jgi:hypothetical protein